MLPKVVAEAFEHTWKRCTLCKQTPRVEGCITNQRILIKMRSLTHDKRPCIGAGNTTKFGPRLVLLVAFRHEVDTSAPKKASGCFWKLISEVFFLDPPKRLTGVACDLLGQKFGNKLPCTTKRAHVFTISNDRSSASPGGFDQLTKAINLGT